MKLLEQDELEELEELDHEEEKSGNDGNKPPVTAILFGIIIVLLVCIGALLLILTSRKKEPAIDAAEALQQDITDYADEQKQNDKIASPSTQDVIIVEPSDVPEVPEKAETETHEETVIESDTLDKTAIIVDVEDENDISYTKEFILNEMLPYFADNNLEAVWDLAHLKRYVKLSAGLKGTDSYYYMGDVDANGVPNGRGLAIYEDNTYYYGSWAHGVRSGDGRWYRFYIDEIGKQTTKKVYQAHSYAGQWSNDLPNGEGAEHYDVDISQIKERQELIIANVIGNFSDGLYDGEMYANTLDYIGRTEEWYAVANKGVFELWRDMSAIGECAVWKNRDDPDLCMDIDKSENKNQGMRELLRITQK